MVERLILLCGIAAVVFVVLVAAVVALIGIKAISTTNMPPPIRLLPRPISRRLRGREAALIAAQMEWRGNRMRKE